MTISFRIDGATIGFGSPETISYTPTVSCAQSFALTFFGCIMKVATIRPGVPVFVETVILCGDGNIRNTLERGSDVNIIIF